MKGSLAIIAVALGFTMEAPAQNKEKAKGGFHTATVRKGTLQPSIRAVGTLQPEEVIEVGTTVAGTIVKLGADPRDPKKTIAPGTPVAEGTVLAELDGALLKVRLEKAKAHVLKVEAESRLADVQFRQADVVIKRLEQLGRLASPDDLARAKYEQDIARAQSEIERAAMLEAEAGQQEALLHYNAAAIRAPVKGVIIGRRAKVGQVIAPGPQAPALFSIATNLKKLEMLAQVSEADMALLKPGQAVSFKVDNHPKTVYKGVVSELRPNVNLSKEMATFSVVIKCENPGATLPAHPTAEVQILGVEKKGILLVPNAALSWFPEIKQVVPPSRAQLTEMDSLRKDGVHRVLWVEERNFVKPIVIRAGMTDGQWTEIVEGDLKEGVAVVTGK